MSQLEEQQQRCNADCSTASPTGSTWQVLASRTRLALPATESSPASRAPSSGTRSASSDTQTRSQSPAYQPTPSRSPAQPAQPTPPVALYPHSVMYSPKLYCAFPACHAPVPSTPLSLSMQLVPLPLVLLQLYAEAAGLSGPTAAPLVGCWLVVPLSPFDCRSALFDAEAAAARRAERSDAARRTGSRCPFTAASSSEDRCSLTADPSFRHRLYELSWLCPPSLCAAVAGPAAGTGCCRTAAVSVAASAASAGRPRPRGAAHLSLHFLVRADSVGRYADRYQQQLGRS